jgi:hypothetical protein
MGRKVVKGDIMFGEDEKKLHSMWTPEMFDRFEADVRKLFQEANPEFLTSTTVEEREEMIAALKKKTIELTIGPGR